MVLVVRNETGLCKVLKRNMTETALQKELQKLKEGFDQAGRMAFYTNRTCMSLLVCLEGCQRYECYEAYYKNVAERVTEFIYR